MCAGFVQRPRPARSPRRPRRLARGRMWLDSFGLDSAYDYDPVWQQVPSSSAWRPRFHSGRRSAGAAAARSRTTCYNHLGHFADGQPRAVPRRCSSAASPAASPTLNFAFLEGGVGWAATLYADLIGHWEKRNRDAMRHLDPAASTATLLARAARRSTAHARARRRPRRRCDVACAQSDPTTLDEWAAHAASSRREDILDLFVAALLLRLRGRRPDDRHGLQHQRLNPFGARLQRDVRLRHRPLGRPRHGARCSRRRGSWSTTSCITEADFQEFTFANPVRFVHGRNPDFFEGTVVEDAARRRRPRDGACRRDRPPAPRRRPSSTAPARPRPRRRRRPRRPRSSRSATSTSPRATRRSTPTGSSSRPASSTSTRTTTRSCCGTRRRAVAAARRDHGRRRQLRLLHRAARARTTPTTCMRMMAVVEGMPLDALRAGADVGLALVRRVPRSPRRHASAVNAGFLVGHSTLRRAVDGRRRGRPSAADRRRSSRRWSRCSHESLAAGALGFSSSLGEAHIDGDGHPVPVALRRRSTSSSRWRGACATTRAPRSSSSRRSARSPTSAWSSWPTCRSAAEPPAELEPARQPVAGRDLRAAARRVATSPRERRRARRRARAPRRACACAPATVLDGPARVRARCIALPDAERRAALRDPERAPPLERGDRQGGEPRPRRSATGDLIEIADAAARSRAVRRA